jgi:hypothetical protein
VTSNQSSGDPVSSEAEITHRATIVGFAWLDCKRCFGRGRAGWLKMEEGTVIPCNCVEFFDIDTVRGGLDVGA